VHLVSGKVKRFAYGTSVLHDGGAVELVDDDAVTVMTLAETVGVTVTVDVFVTVAVFVIVVRKRVVVLTEVLVTAITPGQFLGLMHPPGQTWLSAIRH
jgi:hypothetical protein